MKGYDLFGLMVAKDALFALHWAVAGPGDSLPTAQSTSLFVISLKSLSHATSGSIGVKRIAGCHMCRIAGLQVVTCAMAYHDRPSYVA